MPEFSKQNARNPPRRTDSGLPRSPTSRLAISILAVMVAMVTVSRSPVSHRSHSCPVAGGRPVERVPDQAHPFRPGRGCRLSYLPVEPSADAAATARRRLAEIPGHTKRSGKDDLDGGEERLLVQFEAGVDHAEATGQQVRPGRGPATDCSRAVLDHALHTAQALFLPGLLRSAPLEPVLSRRFQPGSFTRPRNQPRY